MSSTQYNEIGVRLNFETSNKNVYQEHCTFIKTIHLYMKNTDTVVVIQDTDASRNFYGEPRAEQELKRFLKGWVT